MSEDFVHLHLHTEYSLLDGFARIDQAVDYARDLGMPALGITDHGTMFGVIDFYRACKAAEIKPIIGVEAYLAKRTRHDRDPQEDSKPYHMLLLAQNEVGYKNLLKMSSIAQLEGHYYRPRVDRELMAECAEGVIATSGCLAAEIPQMIERGQENTARELLGWYQDVFGADNFYLELQAHDIPELDKLNRWLIDNSRYGRVPLVATNDVHYVRSEDYEPHDTLLCIQTSSLKNDPNRMRMTDNSYFMRTQAEMWDLFGHINGGEPLLNSLRIMEQCQDLQLDRQEYRLPIFPVPSEFESAGHYLRHLCERGLEWRYGDRIHSNPQYHERLDHELNIIGNMGFDTYFLIVWDLCEFARQADIWWNVRGSGAGSLVAYTLGITNLDPLENGLIFERFLNPGRVSMPDFDLDYPEDRRSEMIEYCTRKYGDDKVAAIITFGTLGAKAAIRDVGRALDIPLTEVDRIARAVPSVAKPPKITEMLGDNPEKSVPDLKALYDNDSVARQIIDIAMQVEGVPRHASTHAAGIIVADKPLMEYLPLHRPTKGDSDDSPVKMVTQFPMETAEAIGLLKIDFLGLSTLTILRKACELVERYHGIEFNMSNIPIKPDPDNPEVTRQVEEMFEMIGRGETIGVFQIESSGMRQMLTDMRPKTFEHIIAAISLYRPGPMDYIPTFNRRLHGEEEVDYPHPMLERIVGNTYGILVYQEQLMQVAAEMFGYTLGEADLMRRAVSKKKKKDLLEHRQIFIERGPQYGVDAKTAGKIFDDIEFFARYGFNKCIVGSTEIIDPQTGRLHCVDDLASGKAELQSTLSLDTNTLRLQTGAITEVICNGVKPVYRLTTRSGRCIEATANHPFYTFDGWRLLGKLTLGSRIAMPRRIPVEGSLSWNEHEVIMQAERLSTGDDKVFPDEVFALNNRQIALLIARMWEGDGHINEHGRSLYYATSSPRMARQLQHLFLRFGIVARLREVQFPYKDGRTGYQVFVTGNDNIQTFLAQVGAHFVSKARYETLQRMVIEAQTAIGTKDIIPLDVKHIVRREKAALGVSWNQVAEDTGISITTFNRLASGTKSGFKHETIRQLAEYFDCDGLRVYVDNDVYWDEVVSIEYVGEQPTYDLTIAETHNFVANDFIVHNSHAADYAVITCQTAFLKCHYPHEYMSALMSVYFDDSAKVSLFAADCTRMGIDVLPPDVNHSQADFSIESLPDGRRSIRFGMGAIKNVGMGAVEYIIQQRGDEPFHDLDDFLKRCDMREVGKRALESLIKVGAMNSLDDRPVLLANLERLMTFSAEHHKNAEVGQMSIFDLLTSGGGSAGSVRAMMSEAPPDEWDKREQLRWEKELMGLYVSEHPLQAIWSKVQYIITHTTADLTEEQETVVGRQVAVAGLITDIRSIITKKGDAMAILTLEDIQGSLPVVMFPRTWEANRERVEIDKIYVVRGKADLRGSEIQVIADSIDQNFVHAAIAEDVPLPENNPPQRDAEMDEETGEVVKAALEPEPPPEPVIAPATSGASSSPRALEYPVTAKPTRQDGPPEEPPDFREGFEKMRQMDQERTGYFSEDYVEESREVQSITGTGDAYVASNPVKWDASQPDAKRYQDNEQLYDAATDRIKPLSAPADIPQTQALSKPYRRLVIEMARTYINRQDRHCLWRIFNTARAYPGTDAFCVVFETEEGGRTMMKFPQAPITIADDMLGQLWAIAGVVDIRVEDGLS